MTSVFDDEEVGAISPSVSVFDDEEVGAISPSVSVFDDEEGAPLTKSVSDDEANSVANMRFDDIPNQLSSLRTNIFVDENNLKDAAEAALQQHYQIIDENRKLREVASLYPEQGRYDVPAMESTRAPVYNPDLDESNLGMQHILNRQYPDYKTIRYGDISQPAVTLDTDQARQKLAGRIDDASPQIRERQFSPYDVAQGLGAGFVSGVLPSDIEADPFGSVIAKMKYEYGGYPGYGVAEFIGENAPIVAGYGALSKAGKVANTLRTSGGFSKINPFAEAVKLPFYSQTGGMGATVGALNNMYNQGGVDRSTLEDAAMFGGADVALKGIGRAYRLLKNRAKPSNIETILPEKPGKTVLLEPERATEQQLAENGLNVPRETPIEKILPDQPQTPLEPPQKPIDKSIMTEAEVKPVKTVFNPENIGLNRREIEQIRKHTELDKLPTAIKQPFEMALKGDSELKLDEKALDIADEVLSSKGYRRVDTFEHAGMVIKAAKLSNEYDDIMKEIAENIDNGGVTKLLSNKANRIIDQLDKLTQASDMSGRETARALSIRRMMVNRETYDLASLTRLAKASKGYALTEAEHMKIKYFAKKYDVLNKKYKTLLEKYTKESVDYEKRLAEKITAEQALLFKKSVVKKESIYKERANIEKQLESMGFRVNDVTGISTEGSFLVGKLALTYIKEGAHTLKDVVQKVQKKLPNLSDVDVYQALNTKNPKLQKKYIEKTIKVIRQLKSEAKLFEDLDKAANNVFEPIKSRKRLPENLVAVKQKTNELKTKHRLEGVLADAQEGKFKPTKPRKQQASDIKVLQSKINELRSAAYKSNLDDKKLTKAIQTIDELQEQLNSGYQSIKKAKVENPPELANAKEKIAELRKIMRTKDAIVDAQEQLRTRNFKDPLPKEIKMPSPELDRAQVELNILKKQIKSERAKLAPVSVRRVIAETGNLFRTAKATADMSYALRQGLVISIRRPKLAAQSFNKAFQATFSKYKAEQIDNAMRSNPHHYIREKAGLFLPQIDNYSASAREEAFMSNILERGKYNPVRPIVQASERNMVTGLNQIRSGAFDMFLEKYPNATAEELKAWANWINIATGRGDLGKASGFAGELAMIVFAPRFAISRVQTPFYVFKKLQSPRVRKEVAYDMAALGSLGIATLGLAKMAGFKVTANPKDTDFGKIVVGNTHIDMWGGIQQPMRVLASIGLAAAERAGVPKTTGRDVDPLQTFFRFAQYKLAPSVTIPQSLITGKTLIGEKVTPSDVAIKSIIPLVYEDIYDAYKSGGIDRAAMSTALGLVGVGVNTYKDKKKKEKKQKSIWGQ